MVCSDKISAVPGNRKLSEFGSEPFSEREKLYRNSVPWNKNRSKLSEFHSEPILRKRKMLGIPYRYYRGTKIETNFQDSILNHSAGEKMLKIPYRGTKLEANFRNFVPKKHFAEENTLSIMCQLFWLLCKTSECLGMSTFLRGIRKPFESIPQNFYGTKFRSQP
jgi:hypothetical protein